MFEEHFFTELHITFSFQSRCTWNISFNSLYVQLKNIFISQPCLTYIYITNISSLYSGFSIIYRNVKEGSVEIVQS